MKRMHGMLPLAAIAALIALTGCGTVGEFLFSNIKKAVVQEIKTSTSQAVEQTAAAIELAIQQGATGLIQSATSQAAEQTSVLIQDGLQSWTSH